MTVDQIADVRPTPVTDQRGRDIVFDGATFRYKDTDILHDFDLTVRAGEFLCLLGPSGCGKTTALNVAAGFLPVTEGSVTVGGVRVTKPDVSRPVIFQGDGSLLPWATAEQNVGMGLKYTHMPRNERAPVVEAAMKTVGLSGHAGKYPRELSGGMRQRIQVARALVMNAPVMLMDEPFGALDAQVRLILQEELARIWALTRPTVLFITHDIGEALLLADRVAVMSAGPHASIVDIVEVDLDRPRALGQPGYAELHERIGAIIRTEVLKTM
jgi:NitT/TauT family transport system ATP-binding protein